MKKFALLCSGAVLTAGTLLGADHQKLDQAMEYYHRNQVDGFCVGSKLRGVTITPEQREQISKLSDNFIRTTVIPVLAKHRLEETWIKSLSDPELRELHARTLTAKDEKELRQTVREIIDLMNKKYPILIDTVFADPEYQAGFQKLLTDLKPIVNIPQK